MKWGSFGQEVLQAPDTNDSRAEGHVSDLLVSKPASPNESKTDGQHWGLLKGCKIHLVDPDQSRSNSYQ